MDQGYIFLIGLLKHATYQERWKTCYTLAVMYVEKHAHMLLSLKNMLHI